LIAANADLKEEVAERRQAEMALANEEERLAVTLRSIADGVITTDRKGKIVLMNQAAERLTGWKQETAMGMDLADVSHPLDENHEALYDDLVRTIIETGQEASTGTSEARINSEGYERIVAESGAPLRDNDGTILGAVIVFRDITEERRMEEELLKIRKLESVGTLAGGIAHDFNNLLAVILGNISLTKLFVQPESKAFRTLEQAESATLRSKDLTYRLLTFARGGEPVRRLTPLKELIEDSAALSLSGSNVNCNLALADDLYQAEVDQGQIRQVIYNLMKNGGDAMPEGGSITVKAENVIINGANGVPLPEGAYVKIAVEDQGSGIPEADLQRIFDPYFTNKELGSEKGIGLGLAICHAIVRNHRGFMTARSEVGVGTTLYVYLPALGDRPGGKKEEDGQSFPEHMRILFMDDEQQVRDMAGEMLVHLGYDVAFAEDGTEAIRYYEDARKSGRPFDMVMMDLTVPGGMGGKETIRRLRESDPDIKAIVSSGYSNDPIIADFREYGFSEAIVKPYKIDELSEAIRKALSGGDR
jgi:PAS domain S-box-containing protein